MTSASCLQVVALRPRVSTSPCYLMETSQTFREIVDELSTRNVSLNQILYGYRSVLQVIDSHLSYIDVDFENDYRKKVVK